MSSAVLGGGYMLFKDQVNYYDKKNGPYFPNLKAILIFLGKDDFGQHYGYICFVLVLIKWKA